MKAGILSRFDNPRTMSEKHLPRPFGVFYVEDRPCYEDKMIEQIDTMLSKRGAGDLDALLRGKKPGPSTEQDLSKETATHCVPFFLAIIYPYSL